MKPLETTSLILREFKADDWRAVHDYAVDPEVVHFMPWGPNSEEETRGFISQVMGYQQEDPREHYELAVILKSSDRLIGACGVHVSGEDEQRGWIGYCLNREFWGCGYGTEVAHALVSFGFEGIGFRKIVATCDPENVASERVLKKAGMHLEERIKNHKEVRGHWRDSLKYAIEADT